MADAATAGSGLPGLGTDRAALQSHLLTGSEDGTARILDGESGRCLQLLSGHEAAILSVSFSPDGRTVLTTSADRTARLPVVAE